MKKHKICIVGGGLTGLISALVLSEKGLDIDTVRPRHIYAILDTEGEKQNDPTTKENGDEKEWR